MELVMFFTGVIIGFLFVMLFRSDNTAERLTNIERQLQEPEDDGRWNPVDTDAWKPHPDYTGEDEP